MSDTPVDPSISSQSGKYVNISGLQAFYNELKNTDKASALADQSLSLISPRPIANSAISQYIAMQGTAMSSLSSYAQSGAAASAWISDFIDSGFSSISAEELSGHNVTADNLSSTSATLTHVSSTDISAVNTYVTSISSTYITASTASGESAKFDNISATNITGNLAGTADYAKQLATAQNIAATGDANLSNISFDGSTGVTGKIQITNVPWSAMANVSASGIDATTNSGFVTPKQVNDAITASMSEKAAFKGPYTAKSDIPAAELDHLSIYLVGPTGTGPDVYEEYILPNSGTTTADLLQIGDTSTDLRDYLKTSAFTAWSGTETSVFSGTSRSANSAGSASTAYTTEHVGNETSENVITSAAAGSAASAWISEHIDGDAISAETIIANNGFSGTNISGANGTTSTIDNLIGSAQSGMSALNWIAANSGNMGITPYSAEEIVNGIAW